MSELVQNLSESQVADVRIQMQRVTESDAFAKSLRLRRFFVYIVEQTLAGRGSQLNQHEIAQSVFDRDATFDPAIDAIVRVEAGRLRTKLREYYMDVVPEDGAVIALPKGGYAAEFTFQRISLANTAQEPSINPMQTATSLSASPTKNAMPSGKPIVAVLPFVNMSTDPEQEYVADGFSEDLMTDLSRVSDLQVIARQSTFVYKGSNAPVRQIAADLGADFVIEGSIRKSGLRLRINAQLIDGSSETHIWADRRDISFDQVFSAQEEINRDVAGALKLAASRQSKPQTGDVEAYDYVLLGMKETGSFTRDGFARANYCYQQAVELDPTYSAAFSRLSYNRIFEWIAGWSSSYEVSVGDGVSLARVAVSLDEGSALNQTALSWALIWSGCHDKAIVAGRAALELNNSSVDAHERMSLILSWTGSVAEARTVLETAKRLNPLEPYNFATGMTYYMEEDYAVAVSMFEASLERYPNFLPALLYLGASYGMMESRAPERNIVSEINRISPEYKLTDGRFFIMKDEMDQRRFVQGLKAMGLT